MTFDIHIHIDDQSQEALNLETIINRDGVSPEEAVRRILRNVTISSNSPGEEMIGAFSSPEDIALMDEVMKSVQELRASAQLREFGL